MGLDGKQIVKNFVSGIEKCVFYPYTNPYNALYTQYFSPKFCEKNYTGKSLGWD